MKPKILLIAVLAVIGIIVMSGCIGEKETEPEPTPPANQTQPEVKELSINEIIEKTKTAIDNAKTYEFEQEQKIIKPSCIEEDGIKSKVDRINEKISGASSTKTKILVVGIEEEIITNSSIYVYDGISYTSTEGFWIKTGVDFASEDILGVESNLLLNAELADTGKVDGKDTWILKSDADESIFYEIFMAIGGDYIDEVMDNVKDVKVSLWISKDTFLPVKEQRSVRTQFRGDEIEIKIETKFYGYNEPLSIELPAESKTAVDAEDLLKPVPNPEDVGKTINAINDIKSYETNIVKSITKADGNEMENINIQVDREKGKVMIIESFSISVEGFEIPIVSKTYAVGDKEYTIHEYESDESNAGKSWLCIYSEWETEDLLKQLEGLFEDTNVVVTKANDSDSLLFEVNVTKDIFINDFGELAALTEGLGTLEAERLTQALDANAKNTVMKIWVSKDTFLPIKEELSIESMFKGSKMIINKKIEFQNYNEPVTITLPGSTINADCISVEIC